MKTSWFNPATSTRSKALPTRALSDTSPCRSAGQGRPRDNAVVHGRGLAGGSGRRSQRCVPVGLPGPRPEAVVAAGRAAYLAAWPDDPVEDVEVRVPDVVRAVSEIVHAHGFWSLHDTAGLEPDRHVTMFLAHDGEDDDFDEDPFAISRA